MKKTILAAILFASCIALSTSCQKENIIEQPATLQTLTLTAEGFTTDTKTSVNGNDVSWVNGDEVKLNGTAYAITLSEGHATVEADLSGATAIYGYYPADIVSADEGTTAPTVNLPNCYSSSFDGSGNQIIALPMAAYRNKGGNYVNFKHLTAAVSVTIKNETGSTLFVDAVTVSAATYRLNGSITLDLTAADYGIAPVAATDAADRAVKVTFGSAPLQIAVGETASVQVPIRPIDDDDLTIDVDSHNADITGVPVSNLTHKFNYTAASAALGRNVMLSAKVRISPQSANVVSKGTFSISDTEAIYFSKGNLQATTADGGMTWSWALAPTQLSYVGAVDDPTSATPNLTANNFVTDTDPWFDATKNGTVDLFGWVQGRSPLASSTASGAPYGIAAAAQSSFEGYYSDGLAHDWGETIGNGWFTLSKDQWNYLLYYRGNEGKAPTTHYDVESSGNIAARWFKTTVADVAGLVLIPDDFIWPATVTMRIGFITKNGSAFPVVNNQNSGYTTYPLSATEWTALEEAGCVFLPAAGWREGSEVKHVPGAATQNYNSPWGYYWSATFDWNSRMVYALDFMTNGLSFGTTAWSYPHRGLSVRLAYPAN